MNYTSEEIGLIDGVIQSYFSPYSVSSQIRQRYWKTHQHMEQNQIDRSDLVNINEALSFLLSAFEGNRQIQKDMLSVIAKTNVLLKMAPQNWNHVN